MTVTPLAQATQAATAVASVADADAQRAGTDDRTADTVVPLHPLLAARWSPRSFDPEHVVGDAELAGLVEAARWAPSAGNRQPWRLIVGRRGDDTFAAVAATLTGANRDWAPAASLLVVGLARTSEGARTNTYADYDLGQAIAHLTVQAAASGLAVHQMGGFDASALAAALGLDDEHRPRVVAAVGRRAPAEQLAEPLRGRELASRTRRDLHDVAWGAWERPLLAG